MGDSNTILCVCTLYRHLGKYCTDPTMCISIKRKMLVIRILSFNHIHVLRTKSVTKKVMNKCMAEIYDPGGIRTRAARLISQYLTTVLERILFSSVVMVLAYQPGGPGSNPARIIYFCHAFIHFFLCYGLCS